ncbi:MAG: cobalamin B12-binding domain-containing protein, partial [candidate division WOR-3 bacterium]
AQVVEAFSHALPRLLEAVDERITVDAAFHCGGMSCDRLTLSREYNAQFGRTLLATCDFALTGQLVHEFRWLVGVLSRRGFLLEYFDRMLEAWSIAIVTHLGSDEADELLPLLAHLRGSLGLSFEAQRHGTELTDEAEQFLAAILARQRRVATAHALSILRQGNPLPEVISRVVLPVLSRIGLLWESAAMSAAEEHAATELCKYVLLQLFDAVTPDPAFGRRALIACVPDEEHALGAQLVAEYLTLRGWDVFLVGRSAPQEDILVACAKFKPEVLLLSVTMVANLVPARELIEAARAASTRLGIVIGGRAAELARPRFEEMGLAVVSRFEQAHEAARAQLQDDA